MGPIEELEKIEDRLVDIEKDTQEAIDAAQSAAEISLKAHYKRRLQLAAGHAEPSEEELENFDAESAEDAADSTRVPKGVPLFWLTALCNEDLLAERITGRDAAVLQYLEDVRVQRSQRPRGVSLDLVFRPNPCLTDRVVSHSVTLEGVEESTDISWRAGRNPTVREVAIRGGGAKKGKKKGKGHGDADEEAPAQRRLKAAPSFFRLFSRTSPAAAAADPAALPEAVLAEAAEEDSEAAEETVDVLAALQHVVVPEAYTLFAADPDKGKQLLGEGDGEEDGDDFGLGTSADTALAALPLPVRRRIAALAHNQGRIDAARQQMWQERDRHSEAAATRASKLVAHRRQHIGGVPHFWLKALVAGDVASQAVHGRDHPALRHLADVRVTGRPSLPGAATESFSMEFEFGDNPYFEDAVLSKTLEFAPRPRRPDALPAVAAVTQSGVRWRQGNDLTSKGGSFFHLFLPGGAGTAFGLGKGRAGQEQAMHMLQELLTELRAETLPHAVSHYRQMASLPVLDEGDTVASDLSDEDGEGSSGDESDDEEDEGLVAARAARRESRAAAAAKQKTNWLRPTPTCLMVALIGLVLLAQVFVMLDMLAHGS